MAAKKPIVSVVGSFSPHYGEKPPTLRDRNNPDPTKQFPRAGEDGQHSPSATEDSVSGFQAACREIGKALAESGRPILLCVPDWNAYKVADQKLVGYLAADFVVAGAQKAWHWWRWWRRSEITLYRPKAAIPDGLVKDQTKIIPRAINNPKTLQGVNLHLEFLPSIEGYYPESFPSVKDADAIILISGGEIHEFVACVAHHVQGEPVVAIPSFGGAAKSLYGNLLREHYEGLATSDRKIRDELGVLEEAWNPDSASSQGTGGSKTQNSDPREKQNKPMDNAKRARRIVRLTERLYSATKKQKERESKNWTRLALACIGGFLVWIFLFAWLGVAGEVAGKSPPTPTTDVFLASLLLWLAPLLAAALGMMLRTILAYRSAEITRLDSTVLIIDIAAAILLAMSFCLIYIIGGWSFKGEAVAPALGTETALIIAGLSLIGLAAGLLLPVEELSTRLRQFISLDKSDKPT